MDNQERKLSSEELEALLKEVESEPEAKVLPDVDKPKRRKKKKKKIRIDMIIAAIVAIVLVVCLVVMIVALVNKAKSNNSSATKNELKDEEFQEVHDVVQHYLNAFLIKDSTKRHQEIAKYVDNMGAIDDDEIQYKDYIQSYSDLECYTKKGLKPDTYVVYAYSQVRFKNIATPAPAINVLYVIYDNKNMKVYIHNGIKSNSDIAKYIDEVSKDKDVQELYESVDEELKEACESDKYLNDFINKLKSSNKTTQKATTKKK